MISSFQVSDIGIWSNILEGMTYLAVGFNVRKDA